jgi:heme/copper-type cytochrome/quinol oxidase subunit 2
VARGATAAIADRDANSKQAATPLKHEGHEGHEDYFLKCRCCLAALVFRKAFFVSFVSFVFIGAATGPAASQEAQNRREFTIVAKDHVFTPDKLDVSQDDIVKITLRSEDRPVSFAIDAYRIVKRAAAGRSITFEFRADQPGAFTFYCNLTMDPGCKEMKGTLMVRGR